LERRNIVQDACHARPLAPAWHTHVFVALLLGVAALGTFREPAFEAPTGARANQLYLPLLAAHLLLASWVTRLGVERSLLRPLIGRTWPNVAFAAGDLGLGLLVGAAIWVLDSSCVSALNLPESIAAHELVPASAVEHALWLATAGVVAFTEELVYRGYLQRQLAALSGSRWLGLLLQALLFGIAHGDQGGATVVRFCGFALVLGGLAQLRRSLLPGMVAHFALDAGAALYG
jgi:uncharacterized protein